MHQFVFLKPEQNGVHRTFDNIGEAERVELLRNLVAIGFLTADDLEDAAFQYAFQHFRQILHCVHLLLVCMADMQYYLVLVYSITE